MKKLILVILTSSLFSHLALAEPDRDYSALLKQTGASNEQLEECLEVLTDPKVPSNESIKNCLFEHKAIERVVVYGKYYGIEVPEVVGRYQLNKDYIDNVPTSNGDINEIISLLPGVQVSEDSYSIDAHKGIRAQEISISGAQAWQTGFFIDGMNYNSRQDPASSGLSSSSINDVEGSVQTMNVNKEMVSQITVFDNNIPAEFGGFSGGVVDVDTISPHDQSQITKASLSYRGTQSDWGQYHYILEEEVNEDYLSELDEAPVFEKNSYNVLVSHKINANHGILFSLDYLESIISELSLSKPKNEERRNINALIKYSYKDGWVDQLDWSLLYAPYEEKSFLTDVLDSDMTIDGGAIGSTLAITHDLSWASLKSDFTFSQSDNSREAPLHFYNWAQAKGKEWGVYASGNFDSDTPISQQGGHGSIDKTQVTASWKNRLIINNFNLFGVTHNVSIGSDIQFEQVSRDRDTDSYYYHTPVQYSAPLDGNQLNCNGYTHDCIELSYYKTLDELEAELGESLDFSNPDHIFAYSENVATTPQYFQSRLVRPEEHISEQLYRYAVFASDNITFSRFDLNLGLRAEYDDFFKNVDLSPRISLGVDVFDDGKSMLILGVSRYYDAGLITYKIREQQLPSYTQFRSIQDGYLQGWSTSSAVSDYKYRYTDVKTPYDDEFVVGWKQTTENWGNFSLKMVRRNKYDGLARETDAVLEPDGFYYIQMTNSGYGNSDRLTFAWDGQFDNHSLWFNISHSENYTNVEDYDSSADQTPLDDLIIYEGELMSKSDLDLISTNFARPIRASMGWSAHWLESLITSVTANYSQWYDTAYATGVYSETDGLTQSCPECESTSVYVPLYAKAEVESRVLVNAKLNWRPDFFQSHQLRFSIDVNNLFDSRTYSVTPGTNGIETGRQLWLGVGYDFN